MKRFKKILCKECSVPCYTGKRGLCGLCYTKEQNKKSAINRTQKPIAKKKPAKPKEKKKYAKKRRKKTPYRKAKDALWQVFSTWVRLRDSDENGYCKCRTCDYVGYYRKSDKIENSGKIQAGHFVPAKKGMSTYFEERNVNSQCSGCNLMLDGNLIPYSIFMEEYYGAGTVKELHELSNQTRKFTAKEFEEMTVYYKKEIEKLKAKKNLAE